MVEQILDAQTKSDIQEIIRLIGCDDQTARFVLALHRGETKGDIVGVSHNLKMSDLDEQDAAFTKSNIPA